MSITVGDRKEKPCGLVQSLLDSKADWYQPYKEKLQ